MKRAGTYFAYLSIHLQLGPIMTTPVAGELCESSLGWQSLYYLLGGVTFLSFGLFYWFYRDSPTIHRNVSHKELTQIQKNKIVRVLEKDERISIPYKAILTDRAVWGCFISTVGGGLAFQLFFQYGPVYLNRVLGFDVKNTGFASALPYVLSMIVKFIAGPLSDNVPYLNDRWKIIMFSTISQAAMAICMIVLAFLPAGYPFLTQCFFAGTIAFR
jgi:sugar phosphate permease